MPYDQIMPANCFNHTRLLFTWISTLKWELLWTETIKKTGGEAKNPGKWAWETKQCSMHEVPCLSLQQPLEENKTAENCLEHSRAGTWEQTTPSIHVAPPPTKIYIHILSAYLLFTVIQSNNQHKKLLSKSLNTTKKKYLTSEQTKFEWILLFQSTGTVYASLACPLRFHS